MGLDQETADEPATRVRVVQILTVCVSILLALTVFSWFGEYSLVFEVLSHFVVFYCVSLLAALGLALALRARKVFFIAVAALLLNLFAFVPQYFPVSRTVQAGSEQVSIMFFNCEGHKNRAPNEICELATDQKSDVVCFCEIDEKWSERITESFKEYPYKNLFALYGGIGIVSRLPISSSKVILSDFRNRPRMLATVLLRDGRAIDILIVHPSIPLNQKAFDGRNKDFRLYVQDLAGQICPKIIVGDLNCTPWSYYFQKLLREADLEDSSKGFGPQCTWSFGGWLFPVLPIDHCLVSTDIVVRKIKIEGDAGSDHRPCFYLLSVPKR